MRRGLPMLAAAVAAVLVVLSLLGRARLTGLSGQCLELEERIAALEEENARLLIEHEAAYSAARVEPRERTDSIHRERGRRLGGDTGIGAVTPSPLTIRAGFPVHGA